MAKTPSTRSVRIRDVAEAAGVSAMAVSKVLHGSGATVRVSEATAEHIRKVAQNLSYTPNVVARHFRQGKTFHIGLGWDAHPFTLKGSYYSDLIDGASRAAFERGYALTLWSSRSCFGSRNTIEEGRVDGLIWCRTQEDDSIIRRLDEEAAPIVVLQDSPRHDASRLGFVSWDNEAATRLAVEHLRSLGHRHIALVGTPETQTHLDFRIRRRVFEAIRAEIGATEREMPVLTWAFSADEFRDWWSAGPQTTALIGWCESLSFSILRQARDAGVKIPTDLSVMAYDSTDMCESVYPRLTAARQPLSDMAGKAAHLLIDRIESGIPAFEHINYPCNLDVRESTAGPSPHR